ncbi:utrophin [Trichonephila clavipes]|uniref:Utrophin n=1 Tax=Trichonephila clavipes TaxID=2585209 RepID=A0A8X6SI74_TRICX|nr:utrophin [Trichonephila clavipes]
MLVSRGKRRAAVAQWLRKILVGDENADKENQPDNGPVLEDKNIKKDLPNGGSLQNFKFSLDSQLERLKELLKNLQTHGNTPKEIPNFVSPVPHLPFNKMDHYYESTPLNSAVELNKIQPPISGSCDNTSSTLEQHRNNSTSLDFSNVMTTCKSDDLTITTNFSSLSDFKPSEKQSTSSSLGLSNFLNKSSPSNLSEKLAQFDASKLSPIYLNSSSGFDESLSRGSAKCTSSVTPMRTAASVPSLSKMRSTFTLNNEQSLEAMELELQTMLQQIESLFPQVSGLADDSVEKEKVKNALSEMESAVKKLSHLSLTLSTDGATCHTARATIDLLKDTFGDRLISRFGPVNWPPRSCDLTPLDYFLWGYVKSLVYADKPQTLDHLEDNIRRVIADIWPQMLEKVIENWASRLDYIRASRGSPMPEIIFKM